MTFPLHQHTGTHSRIKRSIQRRAVALAAIESGLSKAEAAERAGITRQHLNLYLRSDYQPGACRPDHKRKEHV